MHQKLSGYESLNMVIHSKIWPSVKMNIAILAHCFRNPGTPLFQESSDKKYVAYMQICCQYVAKQIWRLEILVEKKYVNMEICKYWCKYWCKNKYEAMEICKYGDLYPLKMKNQGVKKNFNSCNNRCGGMWTTSAFWPWMAILIWKRVNEEKR